MTPAQEFECLIALWEYIAKEYQRTHDEAFLECLIDIKQTCEALKAKIDKPALTPRFPLGLLHNLGGHSYRRPA
ncbi:MAG TPA: hypothetical protein VJQ55_08970 [Candidatus Binatia bacterium]|nr:hypothetical protein [Candidatus Binatia bacterium]